MCLYTIAVHDERMGGDVYYQSVGDSHESIKGTPREDVVRLCLFMFAIGDDEDKTSIENAISGSRVVDGIPADLPPGDWAYRLYVNSDGEIE